jgi:hypothetical protein
MAGRGSDGSSALETDRGFRGLRRRVLAWLGARSPFGSDEAARAVASSASGEPNVEPSTGASESEQLARFLAAELRLPLAALARLGARCAAASDAELAAVGRALARESERLDVLVTNTLELGLIGEAPPARGRADLQELIERVVAGHRALIEGLSIRVRVADCSRLPLVRGDRAELLECLSALFSDLLERVPRHGHVELRLRELHGFVRLDGCAAGAAAPRQGDRTTILRAQELVSRHGGELWELSGGTQGFGLTLPREATRGLPPSVVSRSPRIAPALP